MAWCAFFWGFAGSFIYGAIKNHKCGDHSAAKIQWSIAAVSLLVGWVILITGK